MWNMALQYVSNFSVPFYSVSASSNSLLYMGVHGWIEIQPFHSQILDFESSASSKSTNLPALYEGP